MRESHLGVVEKKVLGAMLILSDDKQICNVPKITLARTMGYKSTGGAITFALRSLEMNNYITTLEENKYQVLI